MFDNNSKDERPEVVELLGNIKRDLPELTALLDSINTEWSYDDAVYRFYHQSFKVYYAQDITKKIVSALRKLIPNYELSETQIKHFGSDKLDGMFLKIIEAGTNKAFDNSDNSRWIDATGPILQAMFHAKYFLEMIIKHGGMETAPNMLPTGWASVLTLFRLR